MKYCTRHVYVWTVCCVSCEGSVENDKSRTAEGRWRVNSIFSHVNLKRLSFVTDLRITSYILSLFQCFLDIKM